MLNNSYHRRSSLSPNLDKSNHNKTKRKMFIFIFMITLIRQKAWVTKLISNNLIGQNAHNKTNKELISITYPPNLAKKKRLKINYNKRTLKREEVVFS